MAKVIVYTTGTCPYCHHAKQLLAQKNISYTEIRIDLNPAMRDEMVTLSGRKSVPQIMINGESVGGFDDLFALEQSGKLAELIRPLA